MTRQNPRTSNTQPAQTGTEVAIPAGRLIGKMASKFGVDEGKLVATLRATAFKVTGKNAEPPSNEQMMALMVVADQYGLNPFTRELFAFPDKQNGIVPVVSVDGWARIINEHPQYDGLEFRYSDEIEEFPDAKPSPAWCEVIIHRKDRTTPTVVREYLDEVYRPPFEGKGQNNNTYTINGPWQSHTKRMLRHKTLIQGARIAFGFAGIYDEDEASRIVDARALDGEYSVVPQGKPATRPPQRRPAEPEIIHEIEPETVLENAPPEQDPPVEREPGEDG